ncbi:MAG: hypothetical protein PHP92_05125 [Candidatus Nanoarchaeia archaeon]|nr:hypothetical protein [Candidatus Nanoarchaeia archaeon]
MMMRDFTDKEILVSIGERIKNIPEDKTLKDIVNYYGEDFKVAIFIHSHLTPIQQKALGLLLGGNDDEIL